MAAADARYLNPPGLMDGRRFFSQVVVAPRGTTVYVAGQTGFRADRSIAPTKEGQMVQAFANVKIALEAAQARMDQVVSMTVYIVGYSEADLDPLARLTAVQDAAEAKGVFGVPSFLFPDGDLYWGREHLPRIRDILAA